MWAAERFEGAAVPLECDCDAHGGEPNATG